MEKLNINYEMTFTCDEWLIEQIDLAWDSAIDEIEGNETEEEIFKIALAYALADYYDVSYNEREKILNQSNKIYKWWKENKENV